MVSSLAFMLLGTLAATPCESLKSVPLADATVTAAALVPEGPAPQRGGIGSNAQTGLKRPISPYPQSAQYKGSGDLKDAANWACRAL